MSAATACQPGSEPDQRRLRIAVFNRTFSPTGGGAERYSIALVEQLAARHDIHVFAQAIEHHWPGVTYHRIPMPLRKPRWVNQLWFATATWWATRRGFDVVHSHENTWHGEVQTVHVLPVKYNLFHGRTGWRLALRWLQVATSPRLLAYLAIEASRFRNTAAPRRLVATSPALNSLLMRTYPASTAGLSVIPPGVAMPAAAPDRIAARQQLGLPLHGRLIAFVANDYQKKGLDTLLQALQSQPGEVSLAVVGNPSHIARFRHKAEALGVAERVHFLGHLGDVSPLYGACDVLAHPTLEDTFAMVVLEAMAHSRPVIISDARYCGIAGLLSDGVNALILTSPTDALQLSAALTRVLQEPALCQRLAERAHDFAAQSAWPAIARQQELMYLALACAACPAAQPPIPSRP